MPKPSDKREAALQATLELITEQGFHAAPMSQIAERARISVGTIYIYFKNKEELINALYIEIKKKLTQKIVGRQGISGSVKDRFKQYLKGFMRYSFEHPAEILFTEQYENSPLITKETRHEIAKIVTPLRELFETARNDGLLKDLPLTVLLTMFSGAVMSYLKMHLSIQPEESELEIAIEAIWDMISIRGNEE